MKSPIIVDWWRVVLLLGATIASILNCARAARQTNTGNNRRFDPAEGNIDSLHETTSLCDIPPYQEKESAFYPNESTCAPLPFSNQQDGETTSPALTLQDAEALAQTYAPVLFFHPLENYTLESVDATFRNPSLGRIYHNANRRFLSLYDDRLTPPRLLSSSRDLSTSIHSHEYFFVHELTQEYAAGAGYYPDPHERRARLSRAPIYYNVIETGNGTWTFNYYFYYTFNGHSNLVSLSSYNGTQSYTSFQLSPYGAHEGDWEGMSVMVCRSASESVPLAVTYRQHAWSETNDCTRGECTFYRDTLHPVGFSALFSHGTYPTTSLNMAYTAVEVPFIVNLQGVLVVDRTAYLTHDNEYMYFKPNATNVHKIEDPEHLIDLRPEQDYWMGFGGKWGNSTEPSILPEEPTCLNAKQTQYVPCPNQDQDPIFHLILQLFGLRPPTHPIIQAASTLSTKLVEITATIGSGPTGPITKPHFTTWTPPLNAPLWNQITHDVTDKEFCRRLMQIPDTTILPPSAQPGKMNLQQTLIITFVIVLFTPLLSVVCLLWLGSASESPIRFDEHGVLLPFPTSTNNINNNNNKNKNNNNNSNNNNNNNENINDDDNNNDSAKTIKLFSFSFGYKNKPKLEIYFPVIQFTFWYMATLGGVSAFYSNFNDAFVILQQYFDFVNWTAISRLIITCGVIFIFIFSIMCCLMWWESYWLWGKIVDKYNELKGATMGHPNDQQRDAHSNDPNSIRELHDPTTHECGSITSRVPSKHIRTLFVICYGLLFLSMVLAVVDVLMGIAIIGFSIASREICRETIGSLTGVCLDLSIIGGKAVMCGTAFDEFCQDFASVHRTQRIFWGSLVIMVSHFFLISAAGAMYHQQIILIPFLNSLPTRQMYRSIVRARQSWQCAGTDTHDETLDVFSNEGSIKSSPRAMLAKLEMGTAIDSTVDMMQEFSTVKSTTDIGEDNTSKKGIGSGLEIGIESGMEAVVDRAQID